ncbi:MAG: flippase-like domain-containing protein [Anaerolineaceae bacterium]|nr:flippase-like domain-containing protein [Anaerolineaceae bacterium]
MRKYRNRILTGIAIAFVIYVVLLLFINTDDLLSQLAAYPWELLIPVILLKFLAWVFRFLEWQYYLGVIDARDKISLFDSAVLYLSGYTMAVSPGKIAEVLKAVILKVKTGIPVARSAPVVIAERVVDGVAVVVVAFITALVAGQAIDLGGYGVLLALSGVLLAIGLAAVQIRPLAYFFLDIVARMPFVKRLYHPLVAFYESSTEVLKLRHVLPTSALGAAAHLSDAFGFTIMLSGFGLEITWPLFLQATFIVGIAAAIGALSGIPNGAGITEVGTKEMLVAIVGPANPAIIPVAATAALMEGFFHKWFRVFFGMMVGLIFRHRLFTPSVEETLVEMETERTQKRAYAPESSLV